MATIELPIEKAKELVVENYNAASGAAKDAWKTLGDKVDGIYNGGKKLVVKDGKLDLDSVKDKLGDGFDAAGKALSDAGAAVYDAGKGFSFGNNIGTIGGIAVAVLGSLFGLFGGIGGEGTLGSIASIALPILAVVGGAAIDGDKGFLSGIPIIGDLVKGISGLFKSKEKDPDIVTARADGQARTGSTHGAYMSPEVPTGIPAKDKGSPSR